MKNLPSITINKNYTKQEKILKKLNSFLLTFNLFHFLFDDVIEENLSI